MRDLYQILGVRRSTAPEEIQRAYRRKAKTAHPDGGGSVKAFSDLSTAYTVLSDPNRRERYDRTGEIEPLRPNNLDVSAIEVIAQKLGLIIHAECDVTSVDIDALIEQAIREDIAERNAGISSLRRAMERARRLRDRVKRKADGQANMLARVLDWHETTAKSHIKQSEEAVSSMERALEILKDYSFADDFSAATADDVSVALHDALKALDQLAVMLNSSHAGPEVILGEASPSAFG
ncbi:MAG: DnaJ domain-containing protein [Methyloceanibacter sp.]